MINTFHSPRGSAKLNALVGMKVWYCSARLLSSYPHVPAVLQGGMKEGKILSATPSVPLLTFIESRRVR